jgi:hypothetical protein
VALGLADKLGNLDFVAREVVKAEEVIDYTPRDNVAERLAKRFGAAMGQSVVKALRDLPRLHLMPGRAGGEAAAVSDPSADRGPAAVPAAQAGADAAGRQVAGARGGAFTTGLIRWFVGRYGVNMAEAANPDIGRYASFNDFFTRAAAPGARPLADARTGCARWTAPSASSARSTATSHLPGQGAPLHRHRAGGRRRGAGRALSRTATSPRCT